MAPELRRSKRKADRARLDRRRCPAAFVAPMRRPAARARRLAHTFANSLESLDNG